jgi:hypothetical protein
MTKAKTSKSPKTESDLVPILVWDEGPTQSPKATVRYEEHGLLRRDKTKVETISLDKLQTQYERIQKQVNTIISSSDDVAAGWGVSEVTVRLGLSAKAGLAIIAEVGVEAAIEVTLRHTP